jgi:hypothetical protein
VAQSRRDNRFQAHHHRRRTCRLRPAGRPTRREARPVPRPGG